MLNLIFFNPINKQPLILPNMENEYFILKQADLEKKLELYFPDEYYADLRKRFLSSLPPPVKLPTDEEITGIFNKMWNDTKPGAKHELGFEAGYKKALNYLIFKTK